MDRLLPIKLAIPHPSREPVARPRLIELLDGALRARLVLVSAPPGFGKTTLLVDWLARSSVRSAWLSLDEADNDPVRFLRYLHAAVERVALDDSGELGETAPGADVLDVVEELAGLLAERPDPAVLVLDDYHLIVEPAVQRAVGLLVERLPPQAHVVIATRADPALPLARLRARGELVEVRADALRFAVDEARAFFSERMGLALAEADLETVTARTEGWPAVLQLAALSLSARPDVAGGVRDFAATHRYVLDYVVEEVLSGLLPETQRFLLRSSILERLTGPLCDAVTCEPGGQVRLEELERSNLLIVPLDDERRWYRYHALFADVLRARLAALHPGDVCDLHARASAWHEEHGDDEEAIRHALQSGDTERMSRVVAYASGRHINAGELSTVRRWLDAVPRDVVRGHTQLAAAYAWCLVLSGETDGVAEWLADSERALESGGDSPEMRAGIPTQLAMLRSQLAGTRGDAAVAVEQARLAVELVPEGLPPEAEATLRGTAGVLLAVALGRTGDVDAAAAAYSASLPDLRAGGNEFAVGRTIADLAAIEIKRGNAAGALRLCEAELVGNDRIAAAAGGGAIWAAIAAARAQLGELEGAETAARRALDIARRAGDAAIVASAQATLDRLRPLLAAASDSPRRQPSQPGLVEPLTDREIEVLGLVALGRSNSQIAAELFVTVGTVKSHLHTISGKLGASNRVEAVARGRALGLVR